MQTALGLTFHRDGSRPGRCDVAHGSGVREPGDAGMLVLLNAATSGAGPSDRPDAVESWLESVMAELDGLSAPVRH